jgi:hypothetical protein
MAVSTDRNFTANCSRLTDLGSCFLSLVPAFPWGLLSLNLLLGLLGLVLLMLVLLAWLLLLAWLVLLTSWLMLLFLLLLLVWLVLLA